MRKESLHDKQWQERDLSPDEIESILQERKFDGVALTDDDVKSILRVRHPIIGQTVVDTASHRDIRFVRKLSGR